jgi:molybdopterin-guanine dinucleotide biosynthesis protein A
MPVATPALHRTDITGLVLAGGRGSRMGGIDKGLQPHHGRLLAQWALDRLAPQVGAVALNANRHLDTYAAWGAPVWPDALADFPGPLAGFLAGLQQASTPYLVTVPCDTPGFPADLVDRLSAGLQAAGAAVAIAATIEAGQPQLHPVFCLLATHLRDDLAAYLRGGDRQIARWCRQQGAAVVHFDDSAAFANANTLAELQQLPPPR